MSTSYDGYDDPRAMPAIPPMSTKSTSCAISVCRIGLGRNSAGTRDPAVAQDEVREVGLVIDSFADGAFEVLPQQRDVVPVVDRARIEHELLAHELEQRPQRFHGRRHEAALDPRDRSLGRASTSGELPLCQAVPRARIAEQLTRSHVPSVYLI